MLFLLTLLPVSACATDLEDAVGMDGLTRAAEGYLDGYFNVENLTGDDFAAGAKAILNTGSGELGGILRRAVKSGILLLAVAMLCGIGGSIQAELGGSGMDPVQLAGTAAVTAIAVADIHSLMGLGRAALEQMSTFSGLLLPAVTAACAAAGAPAVAMARQGATLLFLNLLLALTDRLLLPLVYAYVAALAAHAALDNDGLKRVGGLIKWACTGLLSLMLTGFVLYLTVTGSVAGNADVVAQKAAKTALSGMVPVVGSILSDAAETVVAGAGILKGSIGVMGLLVVLAICLVPFLQMGCHYLVYKCASALTATVTPGPTASLMDAIGSAFALVLGMCGGGAMILYIALITSIRAVSVG